MKKTIERIKNYLDAAPIPHGFAAFGLANVLIHSLYTNWQLAVANAVPAVLNEAAAVLTYHRYKKLDKHFNEKGFDERLIRPYLSSPCGKHIAKIISKKYNCKEKLEEAIKEYDSIKLYREKLS